MDVNLVDEQCNFGIPLGMLKLNTISPISEDLTIKEATELMSTNMYGAIFKGEGEILETVFSERDLLFRFDLDNIENFYKENVWSFGPPKIFTLSDSDYIFEAVKKMSIFGFRHLPVFSKGCGTWHMLSVKDLLSYVVEQFNQNFKINEEELANSSDLKNILDTFLFTLPERAIDLTLQASFLSSQIRELSNTFVQTVDHNKTLREVILVMQEKRRHCVILTEYETKGVGVFTERDFLRLVGKGNLEKNLDRPINEVMTKNPYFLYGKHFVMNAMYDMSRYRFRNILIVNDDLVPISILTIIDVFRYIYHLVGRNNS